MSSLHNVAYSYSLPSATQSVDHDDTDDLSVDELVGIMTSRTLTLVEMALA